MKINTRIKKAHTVTEYTPEQLVEIQRCMYGYTNPETGKHDVGSVYFAKNYARIQHATRGDIPFAMYDYQEKMMEMFQNNNKSIVMSARQTGKCGQESTSITHVSPLNNSFINMIRRGILWILNRGLYDELYGTSRKDGKT